MPTRIVKFTILFLLCFCPLVAATAAEPLTLPRDGRPEWLRKEGIVMAANWEPLWFRIRRDGAEHYTPTPKQRAACQREHSTETVERLKALGVNFVMTHCFKGAGMDYERQSMREAAEFAKLCRDNGIHVGVYAYSGTIFPEMFLKEVPQAEDWVLRDAGGKPRPYGRNTYRWFWNRNHPDAIAYFQKVVRFAVEDIKADLLHFDNYSQGHGYDDNSIKRFREYLRETFSPEQLQDAGVADIETLGAPGTKSPALMQYAWQDFCCQSLADSFAVMTRYARTLRPDILMEVNPNGLRPLIRPPVDHGRLLQGGEATWDEARNIGLKKGRIESSIRMYKAARAMDNMLFQYVETPLEMAQAMAFNMDCLGCVCGFEYDDLGIGHHFLKSVSEESKRFIRFYHRRRDLLSNAEVVSDVAVLRNFPSQVFANKSLPSKVEQVLIENQACFQIIYDHRLADIAAYRVLILADCVALSDRQIEQIRRFANSGGRVVVIGSVAEYDEWMNNRRTPGLGELPPERLIKLSAGDQKAWLSAIRSACGEQLSLSIDAPLGLCAELTEQPHRRLVHLVNYRTDEPMENVTVTLRLRPGRTVRSVDLAGPEHDADLSVPFEQKGDSVKFTVPRINVYEIAVVASDAKQAAGKARPLDERPQPWQRLPEPILSAKTTKQAWSNVLCYCPCVIYKDGKFRMWYLGSSKGSLAYEINMGYAESDDGIHWREYEKNPILSGADIPWSDCIQTPFVLFDEDEKIYKMWFSTVADVNRKQDGTPTSMRYPLGYATSPDGIRWQVRPEPIYPSSRSPSVIKEALGRYRMWMGSSPDPQGQSVFGAIYEFTSGDGIHWQRSPRPVLQPSGGITTVIYPFVLKEDGLYHMWYLGHVPGRNWMIFAARSPDGTHWTVEHEKPAFPPSCNKLRFDGQDTSTPCVVSLKDRYLLYYSSHDLETKYDNAGRKRDKSYSGPFGTAYAYIGAAVIPKR